MKKLWVFFLFLIIILIINSTSCHIFSYKNPNEIKRESIKNIYFNYPVRDYPVGKTENGQLYWDCCSDNDFCDTYNEDFHSGEDWNLKGGSSGGIDEGKPVYSIGEGTVIYAKEEEVGFRVVIEHKGTCVIPAKENIKGSGLSYKQENVDKIYSVYLHLRDVQVKVGDEVEIDNVIGLITKAGTGPHLHFEIRKEWNNVYDSYFSSIQQIIDLGFRDPSEFIEANMIESKVIISSPKTVKESSVEIITDTIDEGTEAENRDENKDIDYIKNLENFNYKVTCELPINITARDVCALGNNAYVVTEDTLEIFDISDISNPELIGGRSEITGLMHCAVLNENYLYATSYRDLKTYDISDKNNLKLISDIDTYRMGWTYELYIIDNRLYVATDWGINVLDISRNDKPSIIGRNGYIPEAKAFTVAANSSHAFLGLKNGLMVFEISAEGKPKKESMVFFEGNVCGVDISSNYLFLVSNFENKSKSSLKIFEISDPKNLVEISNVDIDCKVYDLRVAGNSIYLASAKGLLIFDFSDIQNPILISTIVTHPLKSIYPYKDMIFSVSEGYLIIFKK